MVKPFYARQIVNLPLDRLIVCIGIPEKVFFIDGSFGNHSIDKGVFIRKQTVPQRFGITVIHDPYSLAVPLDRPALGYEIIDP